MPDNQINIRRNGQTLSNLNQCKVHREKILTKQKRMNNLIRFKGSISLAKVTYPCSIIPYYCEVFNNPIDRDQLYISQSLKICVCYAQIVVFLAIFKADRQTLTETS